METYIKRKKHLIVIFTKTCCIILYTHALYILFQESRILDERYFRKKSPVLAPIKPEDELKPNFKAKPPKDLEYIVSCFVL